MKPKILIITEFFYPAYKAGGPPKSIFNLVKTIKNNYDIKIICSSKDLASKKNHNVKKVNEWFSQDSYSIIYCTTHYIAIKEFLKSRFSINYSFLYLGSFFNPIYSLFPFIAHIGSKKKIIIAPKGEFFKGALLQKKNKKFVTIYFLKKIFKFINLRWHATNEIEKTAIQELLKSKYLDIVVSSNIIEKKNNIRCHRTNHKQKNQLNILMCGRISPVKNIATAFDFIKELRGNIKVEIWGQIDDSNYWDLCIQKIDMMPKNINITYKGTFHPNNIKKVYYKQDILLMPSLSENFGYAIFEGFTYGVPVITSKNTPWIDLNRKGIGFDIDLSNKKKFIEILEYFEALSNNEINLIRTNCMNYASEFATKENSRNKITLLNHLFK